MSKAQLFRTKLISLNGVKVVSIAWARLYKPTVKGTNNKIVFALDETEFWTNIFESIRYSCVS